ncbi:MAG: hypothetical protein ACOYKZ_01370 [Chlamydiia bacterium]
MRALRLGDHMVGPGYPPLLLSPRLLSEECAPYALHRSLPCAPEAVGCVMRPYPLDLEERLWVWPPAVRGPLCLELGRQIVIDARGKASSMTYEEWHQLLRMGVRVRLCILHIDQMQHLRWRTLLRDLQMLPIVPVADAMALGQAAALEVPILKVASAVTEHDLLAFRRVVKRSRVDQDGEIRRMALSATALIRKGEPLWDHVWQPQASTGRGLPFQARHWVRHCRASCDLLPGHVMMRHDLILPRSPLGANAAVRATEEHARYNTLTGPLSGQGFEVEWDSLEEEECTALRELVTAGYVYGSDE